MLERHAGASAIDHPVKSRRRGSRLDDQPRFVVGVHTSGGTQSACHGRNKRRRRGAVCGPLSSVCCGLQVLAVGHWHLPEQPPDHELMEVHAEREVVDMHSLILRVIAGVRNLS